MSNVVKAEHSAISVSDMKSLGEIFIKSGLFGSSLSEAQAVVKIMAGREIGLEPFAAMQGIDIIQGKVVMKPIVMAGKIKASGKYNYLIRTETAERCEIEFFENGVSIGTSVFTMQDAANMGLATKDNWRKQPAVMLYNRAISKGARQFCPDVFYGVAVYSEGEILDAPPATQTETVVQGIQHKEEPYESYNKKIWHLSQQEGIESELLREYLRYVWQCESLKDFVFDARDYTGIKAAIERGAEHLTDAVIKEKQRLADEEREEPTNAEKELELV